MIRPVVIASVITSLVAPFTFGQVTYSGPRTSAQSPTPTPSPTPATTVRQQRMMRQRSTPAPMPSKTWPSAKLAPVENQPFIPARKGTAAPTPPGSATFQKTTATPAIPPKQSPTLPVRMQAQRQVNQSPTPVPRTMQAATQPKAMPLPAQAQTRQMLTPVPMPMKPTPTPVPPPDVQAYLDRQLANSKDQKFHMTVNGKDLALRPFHVWPQKSTGVNTTSTCVDMRSDEGTIYDIDFVTTGAQVSSLRIHRINGEAVR